MSEKEDCPTSTVELQSNGIIRNSHGTILGRLEKEERLITADCKVGEREYLESELSKCKRELLKCRKENKELKKKVILLSAYITRAYKKAEQMLEELENEVL